MCWLHIAIQWTFWIMLVVSTWMRAMARWETVIIGSICAKAMWLAASLSPNAKNQFDWNIMISTVSSNKIRYPFGTQQHSYNYWNSWGCWRWWSFTNNTSISLGYHNQSFELFMKNSYSIQLWATIKWASANKFCSVWRIGEAVPDKDSTLLSRYEHSRRKFALDATP